MSLNSKLLEKTAEIQRLLDEINAELVQGEFKTPTVTTTEAPTPPKYTTSTQFVHPPIGVRAEDSAKKTDYPPVEAAPPTLTDLQNAGIDPELITYMNHGMLIKNRRYMESDLFSKVNQALTAEGYRYEKGVGWQFQGEAKTPTPKTAAPKNRASKVTRISDIATQKSVTIEGDILDDPTYKDFNREDGSVGSVASFRVGDGSGQARVSVWDDKAMYAMNFVSGDRVRLTALMVKEPYEGMTQLSGGKFTEITKI